VQAAASTAPRTVDFSGVQLAPLSAAILADVLVIEWGLRKLLLKECDLDELVRPPRAPGAPEADRGARS
jgi:protein phosphatase 1 regulatory subunit 37